MYIVQINDKLCLWTHFYWQILILIVVYLTPHRAVTMTILCYFVTQPGPQLLNNRNYIDKAIWPSRPTYVLERNGRGSVIASVEIILYRTFVTSLWLLVQKASCHQTYYILLRFYEFINPQNPFRSLMFKPLLCLM